MKNKILLLASFAAAPALFAFRSAPNMVAFAPDEGSSAVKTFESVVELTLDNMDMSMNGEPSPMMPDIDMSMTTTRRVVVTDEYVAVKDNAPSTLRRTYDELSNTMNMAMQIDMLGQNQSQDQDVDSESELEGKTVVFTWDEDADEYTKAFDPEEDNEELLDSVSEDMDLRVLLPDGDVSEGDEWEIDVAGLVSILAPGGDLALVPEELDSEDMMWDGGMPGMGSMTDWLGELLDGEASGTFQGVRDFDGDKVAVIAIVVDLQSAVDMTDMILEMMEDADLPEEAQNMEFDHVDIEYALEAEGELLWDLGAGHARSFELSGPTSVTMDMGMSIEVPGQGSFAIEQTLEMSGSTNMSVSFE